MIRPRSISTDNCRSPELSWYRTRRIHLSTQLLSTRTGKPSLAATESAYLSASEAVAKSGNGSRCPEAIDTPFVFADVHPATEQSLTQKECLLIHKECMKTAPRGISSPARPYDILMLRPLSCRKEDDLQQSRTGVIGLRSASPVRLAPRVRRIYLIHVSRALAEMSFVLLATLVAYQLHLNLATTSLLQLLVVLAIALKAGFWQATVVSLLAFCCLDYFFIPPVFTFTITDPQNWVSLAVFETSALIVSRLSTEAKLQAVAATARRAELEQLYEMSRQLLLFGGAQSLHGQILSSLRQTFPIEATALFDASAASTESIGDADSSLLAQARAAYLNDREFCSEDGLTWVRVLRLGVRPIGALAFKASRMSETTANALASLTAIALERARALERESRAEAERQSEQLRTTVLDALAHEYKTPLTVIRTATSGLSEIGGLTPTQSELVALIDSETKQLSNLTHRLLKTSRLDTADIRLRPENIEVSEFIFGLLASAKNMLAGRSVHVESFHSRIRLRADRELLTMALMQFLDNAVKYSDPASAITLAVTTAPGAVRISVHNFGPVIPSQERERIFERFFRTTGAQTRAAGAGVGLSVTKKVAEAHQGRVWVHSEERKGNTFFFELPACKSRRLTEAVTHA